MGKLLEKLRLKPYSRRHIINMWQEKDFEKEGLKPCAFMIEVSVRGKFLDLSLTQRSNDYLMAGHINKIQYVALQMMIAQHVGLKPGKFLHKVQNLHMKQPKLILDTDKTNFYDFTIDDFKIKDYDPLDKMDRLELAI